MSAAGAKRQRSSERATARQSNRGALPAIGMEAEFTTVVDGIPQKPEDVFGSPRAVVRGPLVHRAGKSYHLPTGGALYFDTGVMEIATPMIEIAQGCGARGTRSLWENLGFHHLRRHSFANNSDKQPEQLGDESYSCLPGLFTASLRRKLVQAL